MLSRGLSQAITITVTVTITITVTGTGTIALGVGLDVLNNDCLDIVTFQFTTRNAHALTDHLHGPLDGFVDLFITAQLILAIAIPIPILVLIVIIAAPLTGPLAWPLAVLTALAALAVLAITVHIPLNLLRGAAGFLLRILLRGAGTRELLLEHLLKFLLAGLFALDALSELLGTFFIDVKPIEGLLELPLDHLRLLLLLAALLTMLLAALLAGSPVLLAGARSPAHAIVFAAEDNVDVLGVGQNSAIAHDDQRNRTAGGFSVECIGIGVLSVLVTRFHEGMKVDNLAFKRLHIPVLLLLCRPI